MSDQKPNIDDDPTDPEGPLQVSRAEVSINDDVDESKPSTKAGRAEQKAGESRAVESPGVEPPVKKSADPIKRLSVIVLVMAGLLLWWYILADRHTPYTSEARVRGYVVPIGPEISATVEEILVTNNQIVQPGDLLLRLDDASYRIAVNKARADLEDVAQSLGAGVASVAAAETALISAKTNLDYVERQAERTFELEEQGLLSQIHGDTMRTKVEQARIAVTDAEARLEEEKVGLGVEGEDNPRYQSALSALFSTFIVTGLPAPSLLPVAQGSPVEGFVKV